MNLIEVRSLQKTFRVRQSRPGLLGSLRSLAFADTKIVEAVAGISFSVERGEMVGYIGPNGAGKSTTIKMLTGILVPSSGELSVAGVVPFRKRRELARKIGVVFGQRTQLWWDLPLIESLELLHHIFDVPPERYRENVATFTELLDLGPFLATPVRQLSLGQRMRGDLAAALLHDPEILYLDEPTIGLDVVAKARIREYLVDLNRKRETTILLTTHDLTDISYLCERMMIIDHGRLIYDGSVESIRDRMGAYRMLVVELEEGERFTGLSSLSLPERSAEGVSLLREEGPRVWLRFRRDALSAAELIGAVAARYRVRDLTIEETNIEEIVRRVYTEGIEENTVINQNERSRSGAANA